MGFNNNNKTLTWSTQPEKREQQQPIMQRPTRTPSTASYPTLMCSLRWPLIETCHHHAVELVQEIGIYIYIFIHHRDGSTVYITKT